MDAPHGYVVPYYTGEATFAMQKLMMTINGINKFEVYIVMRRMTENLLYIPPTGKYFLINIWYNLSLATYSTVEVVGNTRARSTTTVERVVHIMKLSVFFKSPRETE